MFLTPAGWSSPLLEGLAALIYVLLAVAVSVDVLLKKSDVRGALGWIAAVWLSPILGALLYYMFGINRVTRRAARFGRLDKAPSVGADALTEAEPNIALLCAASARLSDSPLTAGNRVEILAGGDAAYPVMLAAIEQARDCIALASYIFRNDTAGRRFTEALIAAHKRGVAVRVLLDSVGIGYFLPLAYWRMRRAGVPAARFLHTWVPWRMPFLNMRNHRKILVVDGRTAFIGGMNVGAENCRSLSPKHHIEDVHFRVEGPGVRPVMETFARDWVFTTEERLDDRCWWPKLDAKGPVFLRGLSSGPDADIYKLEMILGVALSVARQRVRIVTPYFLPDARLQFSIAEAVLRGVEVEIVLPRQSDWRFMDWATRGHLRFFNHIEAKVYMTPRPFDHTKLAVVDGEWSLIGSSNWDARSFRLNFEYDLECYDRALAKELEALIDTKIARAERITPESLAARPILVRLRDAAARLMMPYL
jgi:cardiolipin synthase